MAELSAEAAALAADLRDVVSGEILVDDLGRAAYATDASICEVRPLAMAAPRSLAELAALVKYAGERGLPIHPRGAGTGLAGESLGPHLVVDTSRYLNRVLSVGRDDAVVEPGCRHGQLQQSLASQGRMFAPDPISGDRCTVGGMVGSDAAGPHSLKFGTTRDHLLSVRAILADGTQADLSREQIPAAAAGNLRPRIGIQPPPESIDLNRREAKLAWSVAEVLDQHAATIAAEQPATLLKFGGYHLRGVRGPESIDLARLLAGSEGTLAVFGEIRVSTVPNSAHRGLVLAGFARLDDAAQAVLECLEYEPSACELLDRRLWRMICAADPTLKDWMPADAEAVIMVEQQDYSDQTVRQRLRLMINRVGRVKRLALRLVEVTAEEKVLRCWRMRNAAAVNLARNADRCQPVDFIENTAVPPARLPEFLRAVQDLMRAFGLTASFNAHAGVGILHTRPLIDLSQPNRRQELAHLAEQMQTLTRQFGGTMHAEHGTGLLRSHLLPQQYPALYSVFQKIKAIFDPELRLNPGKIVAASSEFPVTALRQFPEEPAGGGSDSALLSSSGHGSGGAGAVTTSRSGAAAATTGGSRSAAPSVTGSGVAPAESGTSLGLTGSGVAVSQSAQGAISSSGVGTNVSGSAGVPNAAQAAAAETPVASAFAADSLMLLWPKSEGPGQHASLCNGCGSCRSATPSTRMCPSYRADPTELASPRAKANLLRQLASGQLDPARLASDDLRAIADYCVHCKMCKTECPNGVDIAKLMLEAKAANVAAHGLGGPARFLANLESWARWASGNAVLVNGLLRSPTARWLVEKLWGLSRHRRLRRFHHYTFLRRAAQHGWNRPATASERRPKVAFLADLFINHNDPHLGELAVNVLEHLGFKVYVPMAQGGSGMAALQWGDLDTARRAVERHIKTFVDLARDGYSIVTLEPSAALMLRDEAANLVADPDLDLLARRTFEYSEFLALRLEGKGGWTDRLRPIALTVAYHEPCHQRALLPRASVLRLLETIPALRVQAVDLGCSGMAGTVGMRADKFAASLRAGRAMLERIRQEDIHAAVTQCSACRLQIEQGAGKRTLHPAHWLAISLGLVQRPHHLLRPVDPSARLE